MSKLELILLGRFECLLSTGTRVSLTMRKAEVLLAFLALAPGLRHPRERLINLLWSDRGEEQARNSLRQCLSAIRKSLGDAADLVLLIDRSSVCLNAELVDVDVHEFESLAAEGDYESLVTAADLYQGEFLEGISIRDAAGQEWLDSERDRFRRQFIEILHKLAETQLVSHDYSNAIRSAERLVEQDPLAETGWRLLMQSYSAKGDRGHALQAFKRCQQVLRKELDVDPEQATVELRDRIAGGESRPAPGPAAPRPAPQTPGTEHSIVVLPFDNLSGDPEQEYFSDGITDSIIMNLALFPGLQVKSRNSSFAFKQQIKSIGEISRELGVDYLVEGSVRRSSRHIRVNVQLIESATGNQVWGKRYDSELEDLFELEENLSRSIAATVTGQIESALQRIAISGRAADQQSYDLLMIGNYYLDLGDRENVLLAIEAFERCLSLNPDNARVHANLFYCHDTGVMDHWSEDIEGSRRLAAEHIKKAVSLDPELPYVQVAYANYLIVHRQQFDEAERQLQRALARNPNDTEAITMRAVALSCQGQTEAALEHAELTLRLDPYHPWANWIKSEAQFFCGRYEECIATVESTANAPGFVRVYAVAARVELGRIDEARRALAEFLEFCRDNMPSMPRSIDEWRDYYRYNSPFTDPSKNDRIINLLVDAGLSDATQDESTAVAEGTDHAPSIAVLPFDNLSGDPEQEYFSDGITESLILNLGSFPDIRVKSRHASFAFRNSSKSIAELAAELGAGYVVEGSIRKSADKLRVTVQLTDAADGNQVWGRRFDSAPENLFDVELELCQTIAGTVSGRIEKKTRQTALQKPTADLRAYDYYMRGRYHVEHFTAQGLRTAIELLEKCLALDPDYAPAHGLLGMAHMLQRYENMSENPDRSLEAARRHLERSLEIDPHDAATRAFMAEFMLCTKNFDLALVHARKSVELNPALADGYSMLAWHASATGQNDKAFEYADLSMRIDEFHPYAGWNAGEVYRSAGEYRKAIEMYRSMAHISSTVHAQIAACFAGLGRNDEARAEMRRFLERAREQMISLPASRDEWYLFWDQNMPYEHKEDTDRFFGLLLEAGLCDELGDDERELPSIAVLPFENMSGDPEQEHFANGITADIISTLSKIRNMRIIARHSTLQYKTEKASIAEIAKQQGVRYILEGSVRKSGDRIRVSAELIDTDSGQNCWSDRYDRQLDDLFAVQDDITKNIVVAMKVYLTDGDRSARRSAGTKNIKAWELALLAIDLQDTYIHQNIVDSRVMCRQAIELDPEYCYAWVVLGWTHWQEAYSGWCESFEESMQAAEAAAMKALELEPENGEAWVLAGTIHVMNHEPDKALEASQKALEFEPGNAEVQVLVGFAMNFVGDFDLAREHFQNAMRLCPVCPNWYYLVGAYCERARGNIARALELLRLGVAVEPESPLIRFYLASVLLDNGDEVEARRLVEEIKQLDSSMTGKGLVRSYSRDAAERDRLQRNFEILGLV